MNRRATSKASRTDSYATRPFFSVQRAVAPSFFSQSPFAIAAQAEPEAAEDLETERPEAMVQAKLTMGSVVQRMGFGEDRDEAQNEDLSGVQMKCAACQEDEMVQRWAQSDRNEDRVQAKRDTLALTSPDSVHSSASLPIKRQCATCQADKRMLPKLEIGPVNDPLETEADVMADRVVRRQAANIDDDERSAAPLQAKAKDTDLAESASSDLESSLADASGSGSALAPHTRDQMEEAFGADFSNVRVHTGAASADMNDQIGARAFTYGTDIHFSDGEFAPGTEGGTRLLAHELTHVVQQNSGVRRAPKRIQAKNLVFGPSTGMPKGNVVHNDGVLPTFKAPGLNEGLWIEPRVPGANGKVVANGLFGKPDFYRDTAFDGRPIGINVGTTLTGFLRMNGGNARPQPPLTPGAVVEEMNNPPEKIELGDVKPGQSGEEHLGRDQISNYTKGIKNTAKAVNDYQAAHQFPERWNPDPTPMGSLDVPAKIARPSTGGIRYGPLSVWEWMGRWKLHSSTAMKGSLVVYKSSVSGIWAYEWMPVSIPENVGDDPKLKKLLDRLENEVKPKLHGERKPAPKLRDSREVGRRQPRHALRRFLQRKAKPHEKFNDHAWQNAYNPWRTDAAKTLEDPKTKQHTDVLEALTESKKRTGFDPGTPQAVTDRAKGAHSIRHWIRYGKLYGWFRNTFDRVYVKLAGFAQKVKEKVKKLTKSAGSSGFGNWIKAAALALFKVAKQLGKWAVNIIMDTLLDSLQEGVINIVKQLADAVTPDAVKSKIEELEELKAKYETMLQEAQESLEKRLFGDKLEFFSKLNTVMEIASTVGTIVSVVRWGIRIVACASPPLLGCLWNLAVAALEFAFAKIMETCWFSTKVHGWIVDSGITQILDFPKDMAKVIAEKINNVVPLPEGIGPLFAEIKVNGRDYKHKCDDGDGEEGGEGGGGPEPTEEQKALMDLAKQVGDAKMEAFLEMAAKRAADYNVALSAERIRKLKDLIDSLTIEQMKKLAANQPAEGVPVPVEEFLKEIASLTPEEIKRRAARKIDYDKARRSNTKFERDQIKWKPDLFVASGKMGEIGPPRTPVASDSTEFADAIYDIQQILGIRADGVAGPLTTKTFYERNNVPKDAAYKNAVKLVEAEKRAREEQKAAAERRKEIEALLKDEKVKAALAAAFPSEEQLHKDLTPLNWDDLPSDSAQFIQVNGRAIVVIKTDAGHRVGAYFHYVEREFNGVTMPMIVKTSRFYTLDDISTYEFITFIFFDKKRNPTIELRALKAQKKNSFFEMSPSFLFAKFVRIQ